MNMMNKKYQDWSLLDPKPVLYFHTESDSWLVVWKGIFMTAEHALMLTSINCWGFGPSKEMVSVADKKMQTLYFSGVFDDVKTEGWDSIVLDGVMSYYCRVMPAKIKQDLEGITVHDAWKWYEKMLVEKR
jgi:hypothetical protein